MQYVLLDKKDDASLISFCKNNVTRRARNALGLKLGFFKKGPYLIPKVAYPGIIEYYIAWLQSGRSKDKFLDYREVKYDGKGKIAG